MRSGIVIDINISQMNAYQLIHLSEKQISELEEAMSNATQFVKSGSELLPIVTLKTHNDYFADEKPPFELEVETSFGLKRIKYKNQTEYVKTAVYLDSQREGKEQELISLSEFNKIAGRFGMQKLNYSYPYHPDAEYLFRLLANDTDFFLFPKVYDDNELSLAYHYIFNEMNANRKYKYLEPEDNEANATFHSVVRFKGKNGIVVYYACIYSHVETSLIYRNFLFKRVEEKDIVYV